MSKWRRKEAIKTWKLKKKKEWHNNAEGNEETKKENKEDTEKTKSKKKHRKPVHPIKEMNVKIKVIQKEKL